MFNVQKCPQSLEIYINYNEYLNEDEDESIFTLEHLFTYDEVEKFKGIIDLITVKNLSNEDKTKMMEIYDTLKNRNIKELSVISDNKKMLQDIKSIMPDVSIKFFKI